MDRIERILVAKKLPTTVKDGDNLMALELGRGSATKLAALGQNTGITNCPEPEENTPK